MWRHTVRVSILYVRDNKGGLVCSRVTSIDVSHCNHDLLNHGGHRSYVMLQSQIMMAVLWKAVWFYAMLISAYI